MEERVQRKSSINIPFPVLGLWRQDWGTREKMKKPFSLCIPFTSWAVVLIICVSEHYGMNKGIENQALDAC